MRLKYNSNDMYLFLLDTLNNCIEKYIPSIIVSDTNKKRNICLPKRALKVLKKKHRAWQRFLETRNGQKYLEYARLRNQVRSETRKAKRQLEKEIALTAKDNPQRFWRYATSKSKVKERISELYKNSQKDLAQTDLEKAEVLADFFTSVFTCEPVGPINEVPPRSNAMIKEIEITPEIVYKKLKALNVNKSYGPDELHPRVLKELAEVVCEPLAKIYTATLKTGIFPLIWRDANVTAIFKKGDKKEPGNYRPVSLTCITCKIMESIIRDGIIDHMKRQKLFSKRQFGFINGRSTTLQLLHVLDKWTEIIDRGGSIKVAYMDFRKAFDKVPHRRLLMKSSVVWHSRGNIKVDRKFACKQKAKSCGKWGEIKLESSYQRYPTRFSVGTNPLCALYQ